MSYLQQRFALKNGLVSKPVKEPKPIATESEKKKAENKANKPHRELQNLWFEERNNELIGVCQCGCGRPSSKDDPKYFKHSCCHLFPKALFPSVALQPLNCIERAFWGGCHTNMDEQGLDKWPAMADWEDIKERFKILAPLLTKEERAKKFFLTLEKLVNEN